MKYRYPITFSAMFAYVMQDPKLCRGLLERIFPERKIKKVIPHDDDQDRVDTEVTIIPGITAKHIRLDVLFEEDDTWYDIEMQVANSDDIIQRAGFYHSSMAISSFKRGQDYEDMKTTYVIFICCFDLFGLGEADYFFEMADLRKGLSAGERRYTIILNSTADEEVTPQTLKALFRYMRDSVATGEDEFITELDTAVRDCNADEGVVKHMATVGEELERMENRMEKKLKKVAEEKLEEGRADAREQIARSMKEQEIPAAVISECTGLTEEEIKAL